MGMRTAHERRMQGIWQLDVVKKPSLALQQCRVFDAPYPLTDDAWALGAQGLVFAFMAAAASRVAATMFW